ncbi:hypothetical protein PA598K_00605 [Paenibacillus sp. 598K]|nr:hypothetical protein PA598K_00605 [Paenibacillus sp. 598K]
MTEYEASFYDWKEKRLHHVTLNFPLYQSVEEVWIGVDQDAAVGAAAAYVSDKPVVVYGTSITQGGCASRPGMAYPNLLSRKIPYEFINLGFSGSGKGEPEVARTIASIRNPAMFVVDYEANVPSVEHLAETLPIFIHILRERHPDAPILVVNRIASAMERLDPELHQLLIDRRNVQHTTVERFRDAGDSNVHFLDGRTMLGDDYPEECTVDGLHPTDLGFLLMSRSIEPVIRKLLQM